MLGVREEREIDKVDKDIVANKKAIALNSSHRYFLLLPFFIISAMLAVIFIKFPQIDLFVSGLFYKEGGKFYLSEHAVLTFLHDSVAYITISVSILWALLIVAITIFKKPIFGLNRIRLFYLLLVLAIGPGLVVNSIFKDNWGRARPSTVEFFGGQKKFTPAFIVSDQCEKNCSFVSGDPSIGFYFLALALVLPARRKLFLCVGIGLGAVFSATRIIQGAHFFSDTVFSGIFTFTVAYLLYIALQKLEEKYQ